MIIKSHSAALFLDVSIKQDKLGVSISDEDTPFYQYEEISFNLKEIESLCSEVRLLLNKSNTSGQLSPGLLQELKKVCLMLYDRLLSTRVKGRLKKAECENLVLRLDERLVFIPWELLFNGEDFMCLAFNVGRRVITTQPLTDQIQRQPGFPLKMLILADPVGDLPEARKEVKNIRDQLDCNREVLAVSAKTGAITVDYVTRHMRDFDFIHFAGHTDYEENQPSLSGWRLSDGQFSAAQIEKMRGGSPFPLLIFLNSCQSAHVSCENVKDGYEQKCFGLIHAFLTAGIRHYIGTLWEIPDSVGLIIASEFYGCIKEGAAIGEALRQARRKAMKEFGEENIVWAGYVLYGDPKYAPFPRGLKSSTQKSSVRIFSPKAIFKMIIGVLGVLFITGSVWLGLREKKGLTFSTKNIFGLLQNRNSRHSEERRDEESQLFKISHDRLTQLTLPSPGDSIELASLKHRLAEAPKANDPALAAQAAYDLADKLKERLLEKMIFSTGEQNTGQSDPAITDSYFRLIDLYHTAQQYADQINNYRLAAYALLGTAEVNRWRREYHAAIGNYEKAVELLASIKNRQGSDNFSLVTAYIDLAQLYALQSLDFIKAEESLNKIPALLKTIQDAGQSLDVDVKLVILRQYDYFLKKLAESNYANSHFAAQARAMRGQLIK